MDPEAFTKLYICVKKRSKFFCKQENINLITKTKKIRHPILINVNERIYAKI